MEIIPPYLRIYQQILKTLSVVCNHVIPPAAIQHILNAPALRDYGKVHIDAFIGQAM